MRGSGAIWRGADFQDLQLISDLIAVLVSCAVGGCALAALGQPMISGFLLAGSAVGPGAFGVVKELVQARRRWPASPRPRR